MSDKRRGLGRGIGALIPPAPAQAPASEPTPQPGAPPPPAVRQGRPARREDPIDVFFPASERGARARGAVARTTDTGPSRRSYAHVSRETGAEHLAPEPVTTSEAEPALVSVPGAEFAELPVSSIRPNLRQPRQIFEPDALAELVVSIREVGVLQPIVVRRSPDAPGADEPGTSAQYELIMGERRWRASQEAGLDVVPAIIRGTEDDHMLRDALLENLHRSDLNPLEEASAYQQLLDDFGCTQDELSQRIGRSRPQISNTLRLLRLAPGVQRRVAAGVLSAGHARALLAVDDPAEAERLATRIVAEGLSVRAVEEIVASGGTVRRAPRAATRGSARQPELDSVASRLSDRLDTRVSVALGKSRGRLTVEFATVDDLDRILAVLDPGGPGVPGAATGSD